MSQTPTASQTPLIPWSAIDTVLLDMDGTILDLRFDNYFWLHHLPAAYAVKHGMEFDAAREELVGRFDALRGTLQWYCLDFWAEELAMDIVGLKQEVVDLIQLRPRAGEFLDWMRARGKRLVLITNAHPDSIELKMLNTNLGDKLDVVLSSHEFGYPKEEQEFWHALLKRVPFSPDSALFLDDTASVLRSAQRFGIGYVYGIKYPDSQGSSKEGEHEFPLIDCFADVMTQGRAAGE